MHGFFIDKHYVNYAWGFQNNGTLIFWNGKVFKYDIDVPDFSLEAKLDNAHLVKTLPLSTVDRLGDLLVKSEDEILVDTGNIARDAGGTKYTGYIYDDKVVKKIELSLTGNVTKYNANPAAIELVKEVSELIKDVDN